MNHLNVIGVLTSYLFDFWRRLSKLSKLPSFSLFGYQPVKVNSNFSQLFMHNFVSLNMEHR
eukprot:09991.XXX_231200_231382_1 [CDS] Oithona nana genome sequencing.